MNCPYCGAEVIAVEWVIGDGGTFHESACGHLLLDGKNKAEVGAIWARARANAEKTAQWYDECARKYLHLLKGDNDEKPTPFDRTVLS